jgi:four helix bundle protein
MIWKLSKTFPAEKKFRLADQMIRASRSSTANIAEGHGRFHYQENIQFCRQSRGSLFELIDHVLVAEECEYIDKEQKEKLIEHIVSAIRLVNGYVKYLKMRKDKE